MSILDEGVATRSFHREAGAVWSRAVDAALNNEALNGGIVKVIEQGALLVAIAARAAQCECYRVTTAFERASEGTVIRASNGRSLNIRS